MTINQRTAGQVWIDVLVSSKHLEAEDVVALELVLADGGELPGFSAGAHVDVEIKPGLVRQYSLLNNPTEKSRYRIAVLREPASRGGSIAIHENIHAGSELRISYPKNLFPLEVGAKKVKLIAGGIGITPILAMAEHLLNSKDDFDLHYCCRSKTKVAFRGYLSSAKFQDRVTFHFDDIEDYLKAPRDIGNFEAGAHLYVCGPGGFIDFVLSSARGLGWPEENIHREYFAAPIIEHEDDDSFEVKIASTGQTIRIPADMSVVDVLAKNGFEIPVSCEQGICGTCMTRVLEGEPDHRDLFMTNDEHARNDQFTPCCSRAKSKLLVLDI